MFLTNHLHLHVSQYLPTQSITIAWYCTADVHNFLLHTAHTRLHPWHKVIGSSNACTCNQTKRTCNVLSCKLQSSHVKLATTWRSATRTLHIPFPPLIVCLKTVPRTIAKIIVHAALVIVREIPRLEKQPLFAPAFIITREAVHSAIKKLLYIPRGPASERRDAAIASDTSIPAVIPALQSATSIRQQFLGNRILRLVTLNFIHCMKLLEPLIAMSPSPIPQYLKWHLLFYYSWIMCPGSFRI